MMGMMEGKYAVTMDLYPLESKEWNRIYPFYDHLKEGRLTTTVCKDCGKKAYPPRVICPECLSENLEWVDLPTRGRVLVVTEEEVGAPLGFKTPLIHAIVDLGELILFTKMTGVKMGELKEGDEAKLHVFPVDSVPVDGKKGTVIWQERVFYAFTKA
ncbi:Zn-ribbon domain-containing OB-fold protein [Desulfoscipio gibsoniae]|uniref:Putative nucleic-acid-binding protein containing a Zn-ribbon n=1 Tax=Desulfoscipio gibsoniae DSM 7213 TaxID=767817 RepID=R4KKC2_9FIRM|nr:zinc ribbon domain-containing protein [Desulfoscipio gibsoniae]AGL00071.1 putative nucleic-acid-binding protein containing a Zn-ribbon [Desulfoscipio gibsoniae DSM 7213]